MQFTVINNCSFAVCVFASNVKYTSKQLGKMINPQDILKKAIYDYYWHNKLTLDWVDQTKNNLVPYFTYYGFARPTDSVEVYNLNRVSEYLYVFFTQIVDKKITLWYYMIPTKYYFNQYDTMAVYQYTISLNEGSGNTTITSDANTGALLVEYFGDPDQINQQQLEWTPTMEQQSTGMTWQLPLIVLALVAVLVVAIIIVFAITIKQPNSVNKYISNNVENIRTVQPEYLS